ncbi:MAG: TonB-dependent receptor plug domain-containing protein [Bacteroidales bacterium]|jgi:TonB-dependent outer membrane receptor, SusC/RagA subfamily, signature region|nr:TonB-dependent receptor plug domain-containing protein [Bacteroidales bacterium]
MKHILPILTLVLLLAAGCGGSKNLPANVKTQSHSDGYVTDETIGVQHIDMKETEEMTYQSFEDYVRTHVSGVDVGSDGSLIIRGISSFNASTKPLILMDGTEVLNTHEINPSEIHSVDVLKDASSTASYGMRGANGVILITTKAAQHAKQAERDAKRAAREARRKK